MALLLVEIQQLGWEGEGHNYFCSKVVTNACVPQDIAGLLGTVPAAAVGR